MGCVGCGSAAVTERPERTVQGYRRFRCRGCGKQWNERSGTVLNRAQFPSDVVALVVLWRLRYKLSLRDLPEMFALRGMVFSREAVREWKAKLTPALAEELRRRRRGKVGRSWHVDETYLKAAGRWCYVYRANELAAEDRDTASNSAQPRKEEKTANVSLHIHTICGYCSVGNQVGSMLERRQAERSRMIKAAEIIVSDEPVKCAALDVSDTGARLYLPDTDTRNGIVLWQVVLRLPDGSYRAARRRWQKGNDIGFSFNHSPAGAAA